MTVTKRQLVESFRLQAEWCSHLDSELYASLLTTAVEDLESEGAIHGVVEDFDLDPVPAALPLRFLGGVHRLVLMGLAPELARHYPSVGGEPNLETIGSDFVGVAEQHPSYLRDALSVAPQTNEVGRSMYLLPGLLEATAGTGHDVRLLEIGASGGLNLLLDRYRLETSSWTWGDPDSPVAITADWEGGPPAHLEELSVVERRGCDVNPLPADKEEHQLRLLSFLWPDQIERIERTRGAFEIATAERPEVDEADATTWLSGQLSENVGRGTLTVLQHSVMWQYLPKEAQADLQAVVDAAAGNATRSRPFARVSFEPPPKGFEPDGKGMMLTVTRWPGGETRLLARGHPHGAWVHWVASKR